MKDNALSAKKIALNGMLGAIAVISLLLASVLPTNRLSFYALSSFFIAISIIESGIKAGWIFYPATSLIAFMIVPDKLEIIPYVIFFGLYGIVKYYIEKLNKIIIEYILKFTFFNICLGVTYFTVWGLFGEDVVAKLPWWVLVAAFEVVFLLYDFVYTLFINYYREKLRPRIKL